MFKNLITKQFYLWQNPKACDVSKKESQAFALQNQLAFVEPFSLEANQGIFEFIGKQLSLHLLLDNKPSTLTFDFEAGPMAYRRGNVSKSNEIIAKAIGCKPHYRPRVFDATAGMGRDAMIMAQLGCDVILCERNFAIYHLLNNALSRFKENCDDNQLKQRLNLIYQNSLEQLNLLSSDSGDNQTNQTIDVIYLDPMFPDRKKSALVKKEMRLFKLLAGNDEDSMDLFNQAIQTVTKHKVKRIVVKRPKSAEKLTELQPSHEILGKQFRYDVYLTELFC
jgi:16S rRNA (guanine1516-N2)-methyltransferase